LQRGCACCGFVIYALTTTSNATKGIANVDAPNIGLALTGRESGLKKALSQIESEDGWVLLGTVGKQISSLFSDFDTRTYGSSKLSDLVRKTDAFEIENVSGDPMRIRAKPTNASQKARAR